MPYRIKGTLKLPSGQPAAGVDIEFISRRNYSPLLMDLSSIIKTTSTGAYDITLEYGEYAVVVYWGCNQPSHIGKLFVFSDTAAGLDLQTLLQQADWQPATPEYIQQIQDWLAQAGASASQAVNSAAAAKASETAVEADREEVASNKAIVVNAQADVSAKASDVTTKAEQVAANTATVSEKTPLAVAAADTASQKAVDAAASDASARTSASQAANSASSAKSEADRSKAEADRASQAVIDSAVPFPDVWVPFNDSLRMFAGYGREVKVGDDVVARMVNFERSTTATYIDKSGVLRTAAINEPRFEKQGLLIEGQSANLHSRSETTTVAGVGSGTATPATLDGSPAILFQNTGGEWASVPNGSPTLTVGGVYTISVDTDRSIAECAIDVIPGKNAPKVLMDREIKIKDGLYRRYSTFTSVPSSNTFHYYVSTVTGGCRVGRIQVEELQFASSYIPTNGTAVTRVADKVTIPRLNNDCVEWYSGADKITPIVTADEIQFVPPAGKYHLRNVKGFFTALTEAQKKALK